MAKHIDTFEPMTLGNMRANGVRSLLVYCLACRHEAVVSLDRYSDEAIVSTFGRQFACTTCGKVGADARPNWGEREAAGTGFMPFRGAQTKKSPAPA